MHFVSPIAELIHADIARVRAATLCTQLFNRVDHKRRAPQRAEYAFDLSVVLVADDHHLAAALFQLPRRRLRLADDGAGGIHYAEAAKIKRVQAACNPKPRSFHWREWEPAGAGDR